jgi:hypothetical protein
MKIIKSFNLFGFKINENVYRPYVKSLENLESYKRIAEWSEINIQQSQDGKITKITIYPNGKDDTVLKYELKEWTIQSGDRVKIGVYEFKDFEWEYVMGYSVSNVSDYESMFSGIEKRVLKDLYSIDIGQRNFLSSVENLEPIEDCKNPDLMRSLISRIPEWKVVKFFKDNPTMIYMLHSCPDLKKKVMDKAGISDFSNIGRALKRGFI